MWGWGLAVCELGWRGFVADVAVQGAVEVGEIGGVGLGLGVGEYVG